MEYLSEIFFKSVKLLFSLNKEIINIIFLSLKVSLSATVLATIISLPLSIFISFKNFPGKKLLTIIINSFLSFPAIVIGLLVYVMLSRRAPLGALGLLYTPGAMIIAQTLLAMPLICALAISAFKGLRPQIKDLAKTLGANNFQLTLTLIKECRYGLYLSVITGFSRVIGETGMTMMVGGNIKNYTQVMTTTIALETMKGNFELGIALGLVLLFIAFILNFLIQLLQFKNL